MTDDERCVPIKTVSRFAFFLNGFNIGLFAGFSVVTNQSTVLPLAVNQIRFFGIHAALKSVSTHGHKPIGIGNAAAADGAGRTTQGVIVLRSAIHVVKRFAVIGTHAVKLSDGQIGFKGPVVSRIKTLVQTSVATNEVMRSVIWINPNGVVIHVFTFFTQISETFSAIGTHLCPSGHGI